MEVSSAALSETELAARAGIDRGALINIEKGRTRSIDFRGVGQAG